jgi:transcriptional regulator with GAF, ATPase, and Fis domain
MILRSDTPQAFLQALDDARETGASRATLDALAAEVGLALKLRARLDEHRRREEGLAALYETAVDLTSLHDVETVLRAIVRRARQLLQTDTAYLTLNDEDQGETYMRVSVGTVSPRFEEIRLPFGRGVGGIVAATGGPYFTNLYLMDDRLKHHSEVDEIVREEGLVAILGVPLILGGRVIGVLFASDRRQRTFQPEEVNLLSSLGALAALALENARLFQDLQRAVDELHVANERDRVHSGNIQWAASVHERLTALVAEGGDTGALAEAVAEVLEGSVVVLDEHGGRWRRPPLRTTARRSRVTAA